MFLVLKEVFDLIIILKNSVKIRTVCNSVSNDNAPSVLTWHSVPSWPADGQLDPG